jgi:tRNA 2-selenouridine synthase
MGGKDENTKELFDFVRSVVERNIPSLKDILKKYDTPKLEVNELLGRLNKKDILLIDARSEKEFEESPIPAAVSFPVLNNFERHNVGLIYKNYSSSAAVWLAIKYAEPKAEPLAKFLEENNAADKDIVIYCWRGGGRSGYLAKMVSDLGYKPSTVTGGFKSYRRKVTEFFSREFPYPLIELSGLTGSGKTELLRALSKELPVIDLEQAARHYSSLLGSVPYDIMDHAPVKSQSAFENAVYGDVIKNYREGVPFLIESESKKVGRFQVPETLYAKMLEAPSILVTSGIETRVQRIVRDYFSNRKRGIAAMKEILISKQAFFRQQLSNALFDRLIVLLDEGDVSGFTRIMIEDYYDKRYKDKGKKHVLEVSMDSVPDAIASVRYYFKIPK